MRVDVADGDAFGQSGPGGRFGDEAAGGVTQPADGVLKLGAHEVLELRVQGGHEILRGVAAVLVDPLVAGRASVAHIVAAKLPDDPVCRFHPVVHGGVAVRVFLEELNPFGEFPLGGDQSAVAREPGFTPLGGQSVDPARLRLRCMASPQFDVCVRPPGKFRQFVQRGAVGLDGNHGTGREVSGDPDDAGRIDSGVRDRFRYGVAQDVPVVIGDLEGPFAGKPDAGVARRVSRQFVSETTA